MRNGPSYWKDNWGRHSNAPSQGGDDDWRQTSNEPSCFPFLTAGRRTLARSYGYLSLWKTVR